MGGFVFKPPLFIVGGEMVGVSTTTIGLVIAFIYIINLVIQTGISYFFAKNTSLNREERDALFQIKEHCRELQVMHNVKDEGGTPLWYVPPSLEGTLREISASQSHIVHEFDKISSSLDSIATILGKMSQ